MSEIRIYPQLGASGSALVTFNVRHVTPAVMAAITAVSMLYKVAGSGTLDRWDQFQCVKVFPADHS